MRSPRIAVAEGICRGHVETAASLHAQSGRSRLMAWFEKFAIVAFMVLFMECFAWAAHRYVMHGWGWGWHKSHHEDHDGWFEKNDLYAIVFAIVPIVLFVVGLKWEPLWWAALGITVYGGIYAFVHDMLVHQRGGFRWVPKQGYFKRLLQAHRLHHAVEGKGGTVSHGFLFARKPAVLKAQLRANAAATRRTAGSGKTATMAPLAAEK
jgi:beta-carotene 3-hydroxylase